MTAARKTSAAPAQEQPKTEPKETLQQLKNRLRNEAEREVVNNHRDEYHQIAEAKFKEHGIEFTRRLTDEEKAAEKIREMLRQFPELRGQFSLDADGKPEGEEVADPQDTDVVSATTDGESASAAS